MSGEKTSSNSDKLRVLRTKRTYTTTTPPQPDENTTVIRRTTTNNVIKNNDYVTRTDRVFLNDMCSCPNLRFPWWIWLLLGLGLLTLLALALGLGLGLGLRKASVNGRCRGGDCPSNAQCINSRCECYSNYFYDYTTSSCSVYRHVGMTCTTSNANQQCITNAYCASNGYCICSTGYFLDQVIILSTGTFQHMYEQTFSKFHPIIE